MKNIKEDVKWFLNYKVKVWEVIILLFIVSLLSGVNTENVVYKDKIVEKEIVKEVNNCSDQENEISRLREEGSVYREVIGLDNKAFEITGDIMGNLTYYIYFPDEINKEIQKIEVLGEKKWNLINYDLTVK